MIPPQISQCQVCGDYFVFGCCMCVCVCLFVCLFVCLLACSNSFLSPFSKAAAKADKPYEPDDVPYDPMATIPIAPRVCCVKN